MDKHTYHKKRLDPDLVAKLDNLEAKSTYSFKKVYAVKKEPSKNHQRFYLPKDKKKSVHDKQINYSPRYLQQIGIVPKQDDMDAIHKALEEEGQLLE